MTGEPCHVCSGVLIVVIALISVLETVAARRISSLLAMLPVALQTGYADVLPELEPLKVR